MISDDKVGVVSFAMDLVSFKSFLRPGKPTVPDYVRFLHMLLHGLSTHVVEGDLEDLLTYREETQRFAEQVSDHAGSEDILLAVASSLRSLEEYTRRATKFVSAQGVELKAALRSTTETIATLTHSRTESVQQLAVIERKMEQASAIEDVRLLRLKLQDCLTIIREESVRLRGESEARMQAMQERVESVFATGFTPGVIGVDPVTCLENHAAAEKLIMERIAEGKPAAAALFVVSKLMMVNRRFGRSVGDEVLFMAAQHIGAALPAHSVLFRWKGPALLAVVDLQPNFEDVNRRLNRIAMTQLEKNIDDEGRIALVPISLLLLTQKTAAAPNAVELFKAMDQFVLANAAEEQPVASS
jgi:GGDEF domain-containing protein